MPVAEIYWTRHMKKVSSLSVSTFITLTIVVYVVYYLLLQDNFLHISISSIIDRTHHLRDKGHLIVLGLLPIYIATMVFGSILLGVYLGSSLQQFFSRSTNKKFFSRTKI